MVCNKLLGMQIKFVHATSPWSVFQVLKCTKHGFKEPAPRQFQTWRGPSPSANIAATEANNIVCCPLMSNGTPDVANPSGPKSSRRRNTRITFDMPPSTWLMTEVRITTGTIQAEPHDKATWPSSTKLNDRTIVFRLLSGANAFPGTNSSHPMMSFQGRFLLGGWRAATLR